jgi:hypothetical protein
MKTLLEKLKKEYVTKLEKTDNESTRRLLRKFNAIHLWSDLTIGEITSLTIWLDMSWLECSIYDIKYGDKFLIKE